MPPSTISIVPPLSLRFFTLSLYAAVCHCRRHRTAVVVGRLVDQGNKGSVAEGCVVVGLQGIREGGGCCR
ncbi:hypothetical protein Hanom_Chr06g00557941 [Helianthus anomalus]